MWDTLLGLERNTLSSGSGKRLGSDVIHSYQEILEYCPLCVNLDCDLRGRSRLTIDKAISICPIVQ